LGNRARRRARGPEVRGRLVLVATPIGNLGDLSPRAVETLETAALVCCEDTRRTGRLLAHVGVSAARLLRVDEHTEETAGREVGEVLDDGKLVAVVTDAGTPGISDPGERLVASALAAGHDVSVVPGPTAAVAALVASGLPTGRFVFEGFLPRRGADRDLRLRELAGERRTLVVYESGRRLKRTLSDLSDALGSDRRAVVARELTKLHEEIVRASLSELTEWAAETPKGEVVLVIEGAPPAPEPSDTDLVSALRATMAGGVSRRDASEEVAEMFGVGRRRVYELSLADSELPRHGAGR
jgi:16S rRNA (cytidine1402-2'-O)-methyltransferase